MLSGGQHFRPGFGVRDPTRSGVSSQHTAELAQRVRYRDLPDGHVPDQLILPGTDTGTGTGSDGEASV